MSQGTPMHMYVPSLSFIKGLLTGDLQPGDVRLLDDYAVPVKAGGE